MLVKSDDGIFCKTFRYINFSKAKKIYLLTTIKKSTSFQAHRLTFIYNKRVVIKKNKKETKENESILMRKSQGLNT